MCEAQTRPVYRVNPSGTPPLLAANWHDPAWLGAAELSVAHFRIESSSYHPRTFARLFYDQEGLHGIFLVKDRYVRCQRTQYFDEVWKDSCVEFFIQPKLEGGYFNFEFNCGGAFLCWYITDPTPQPNSGWVAAEKVSAELGQQIKVRTSLPRLVDPELTDPTDWTLQFFIPFAVLESFTGPLGNPRGQSWRGNFYKCAVEVSHPHWAAWSPVDEFNFHLPRCFGQIQFAG